MFNPIAWFHWVYIHTIGYILDVGEEPKYEPLKRAGKNMKRPSNGKKRT